MTETAERAAGDQAIGAVAIHLRISGLDNRMDHVDERLEEGKVRMDALAAATDRVEQNTRDLVEAFQNAQSAFKVLTFIGKLAKPIWYIAAAAGALFGLFAAIKSGGVSPK